jgi:translation initiation factor 1 (eIF-1/SUI1)
VTAHARRSTPSPARISGIERKIADLQALRRELADIIGQCGHGTVAERRIIEALSPSLAHGL